MQHRINSRRLLLGVAAFACVSVIAIVEIRTRPENRSANAVAFSPDGTLVAALTSSWDSTTGRYSKSGRLWIWKTDTRQPLLTIPTAETPLTLAFDPSGKSLVIGAWDGTVNRVETATGRALQSFAGHSLPVRGLTFTPDGKTLIAGASDGKIILWDAETGKERRRFDRGTKSPVNSMALSSDGRFLAATGGIRLDSTTLWDLETGELMRRKVLDATQEPMTFAPNSPMLAVRSPGRSGSVQFIDHEGDRTVKKPIGLSVRSVAFSPDGHLLATGGNDEMVNVLDIATGEAVAKFDGHKSAPETTAAMIGRFALAHVGHRAGRTVNPVWSVAFSPDGTRLASAGGEFVWLWGLPHSSSADIPHRALLSPTAQPGWPRPVQVVLGLAALTMVVLAARKSRKFAADSPITPAIGRAG